MFERLIDIVKEFWQEMKPYFFVDCWEKAAVLRMGRFHRAAEPGPHWKIPFLEKVLEITACVTTVRLPAQALTTKDDVPVSLAAIVKYEIVSVEPYITGIFDQHDVLCDVTMGAIRRLVAQSTYQDLRGGDKLPEEKVATAVRYASSKYGFKIHEVTFTGFTKARPLMLISQSVLKDLDN